jgi:hypothetical protein
MNAPLYKRRGLFISLCAELGNVDQTFRSSEQTRLSWGHNLLTDAVHRDPPPFESEDCDARTFASDTLFFSR